MCGIAGFVNREGEPADRAILERMTATLAHRGPDGDGFHVSGPVALGHRRLSIIDLAGGAQPMANEDGTRLGHLQRGALQRARAPARAGGEGASLSHGRRHREPGPPLRGGRARIRRTAQRDVRPGALGRAAGPAGAGPRPDGPEAALLRRAPRRRPRLRLGTEGPAEAPRDRPGRSTTAAWRATSSTSTSPRRIRSGEGCGSCRGVTSWSGRRARSACPATGNRRR